MKKKVILKSILILLIAVMAVTIRTDAKIIKHKTIKLKDLDYPNDYSFSDYYIAKKYATSIKPEGDWLLKFGYVKWGDWSEGCVKFVVPKTDTYIITISDLKRINRGYSWAWTEAITYDLDFDTEMGEQNDMLTDGHYSNSLDIATKKNGKYLKQKTGKIGASAPWVGELHL